MKRYQYRVVNGFIGHPERDGALINEWSAMGWEFVSCTLVGWHLNGYLPPDPDIAGYFRRALDEADDVTEISDT
jgi:hypothetical protein